MISAQKDLDLPAHKVMVAHIRCKDIASEQLASVQKDNAWLSLMEEAHSDEILLTDFSERAEALIESCLYGYETDAMYFVDSVRIEQKHALWHGLTSALQPAFKAQRDLLCAQLRKEFLDALEVAADSNASFSEVTRSFSQDLVAKYDRTAPSSLLTGMSVTTGCG